MKKLPIVLVFSSVAVCSNNLDPFEQLHQSINEQIKAVHEAFDKMFQSSGSLMTRSNNNAIKTLDLQNKEDAIEISIEFNQEPNGSVEAQKKSLKGNFEVDGYKLDLSIERNKAYRYIDGSNWVLHLQGKKKEQIKKNTPQESNNSSEKSDEKFYTSSSSYSSTQTINAELDDLKKSIIEQNGNYVKIILPKKSADIKKVEFKQTEPTKIEIAKKTDAEAKELG